MKTYVKKAAVLCAAAGVMTVATQAALFDVATDIAVSRYYSQSNNQWEQRSGANLSFVSGNYGHVIGQTAYTATLDGGLVTYSPNQNLLVKWTPGLTGVQGTASGTFGEVTRLANGDIIAYNSSTNQLQRYSGTNLSLLGSVGVAGVQQYLTPTDDGGFVSFSPTQSLLVKWNTSLTGSGWVENTASAVVNNIVKTSDGKIYVQSTASGNQLQGYNPDLTLYGQPIGAYSQTYMTPSKDGAFYSYSAGQNLVVKWKWDPGINWWSVQTYNLYSQVVGGLITLVDGTVVYYDSTYGYLRQLKSDLSAQLSYNSAMTPRDMIPTIDGGFVSYSPNQGLIVKWDPAAGANAWVKYTSAELVNSMGALIPEPATMALLGLGSLMLVGRKR